ncbi:MAG: hypothetical protein ABIP33_07765 [Pseudolysinimonas sp.]
MTSPIGDLDATRPWLLVNPDDPAQGRWDGMPDPLVADGGTRLNSPWGDQPPQPYELGSLQGGTGSLLVVETRRGLQTVADYFRHRAWNPTLVVVHQLEPLAVAEALADARTRVHIMNPGYIPPEPPFDLALIEPLFASELARGNGRPILEDERPHFTRQWMCFPFPMDAAALSAEFEFAPGIELDADRSPPWLTFHPSATLRDEFTSFPIGGSMHFTTAESRRRREEWWVEWRRAPRPRQLLRNPYLPD